VYDSLVAQTLEDFEWIVVDDGSTDDTESVVRTLQQNAPFSVVYLRLARNSGWHVAYNRAVGIANGTYFNVLDSDDQYTVDALQRFSDAWTSIPETQMERYASVVGLCVDLENRLLSPPFPDSPFDCTHTELRHRYGMHGDAAISLRRAIIPPNPYPEDLGSFVIHSFLLNRLSDQYVSRHINRVLKRVEYRPDGLTSRILQVRVGSPKSARTYYRELAHRLRHISTYGQFRAHVNFVRFAFHEGLSIRTQRAISPRPTLCMLATVPGYLAMRWDVRRLSRMPRSVVRPPRNERVVGRLVKRAFDVAVASLALLLLAPVVAFVAVVVRLNLGAPVLFRQVRPGIHGRLFTMFKFRTMLPDSHVLKDDQDRLTPLGRRLRALSLDELPELVNVIRGEMSLVGPRPLLPQYLTRYSSLQFRRHELKPGITGLAQVSGRNAVDWERRLLLDVWYIDHQSFWLDLKILFATVFRVFARQGISQPGHATARPFVGSEAPEHGT
jgi:lipopolysaccharide/colanic/teichoic acid biosynthesis glycosyltransferase/glycosyltransferase involved in cell wall biosynthesis